MRLSHHGFWRDTKEFVEFICRAAGARVSPDTLQRAASQGMKLSSYQSRNDAYGYFEPLGDLVFTGPTYTNVNDFRTILIA